MKAAPTRPKASSDGFSGSRAPVMAAEAVRGFLTALGVPPTRIPARHGRAGRAVPQPAGRPPHAIVPGQRQNAEQVARCCRAPGMPGAGHQQEPADRPGRREWRVPAPDGRLTEGESHSLLATILGPARTMAESAGDGQRADRAVRPAAAGPVQRRRPRRGAPRPAAGHALRRDAGRARPAGRAGDGRTRHQPPVVFSWSQARLSAPAARMFRLLGIHPGPDITVPGARPWPGCRGGGPAGWPSLRGAPAHRVRSGSLHLPRPAARLRGGSGRRTRIREDGWRAASTGCSTITCTPRAPPRSCFPLLHQADARPALAGSRAGGDRRLRAGGGVVRKRAAGASGHHLIRLPPRASRPTPGRFPYAAGLFFRGEPGLAQARRGPGGPG